MAVGLGALGVEACVSAAALTGAGVALGVTQRAPVFAAVFVWELTHGPAWTLPLLLAACWTAERAAHRPGGAH